MEKLNQNIIETFSPALSIGVMFIKLLIACSLVMSVFISVSGNDMSFVWGLVPLLGIPVVGAFLYLLRKYLIAAPNKESA